MLAKTKMKERQELKLQGYTKAEILTYYQERDKKLPSRPTINKCYDMDTIPDNPGEKLVKEKSFDKEPFRSAIIIILKVNGCSNSSMSFIYDALEEKFIECGALGKLPGNEQTLRNYIHYLEYSGQVNR